MIDLLKLLPYFTINSSGGLFDLNVTLLLIIIQFIILMTCLNEVLYKPIYLILEDRKKYILKTLNESAKILQEIDKLNFQYKKILHKISKKTQIDITTLEETQKTILKIELNYSQNNIKNWLKKIFEFSTRKQHIMLKNTKQKISFLYHIIEPKLTSFNP